MMFWCSHMTDAEKCEALQALASGRPIVATYGLSVGLNLTCGNRRVRDVVLMGLPYNASSAVQAASRIRDGGTVHVFVWDLAKTAQNKQGFETAEQVELATFLLTDDVDGIFDLFSPSSSVPPAPLIETLQERALTYQEIRIEASVVRDMDVDEKDLTRICGICCGYHATNRCYLLYGKCFCCGLSGHGAKTCQHRTKIPAVRRGFCCRCMIPIVEVAGVQIHKKDEIGQDCKRTALADLAKMLLLSGTVGGVAFGPPSYLGRLEWATQGSGPNIVTLLAHAARIQSGGQSTHTPSTLLRKRPASLSLGSSSPKRATPATPKSLF